MRGGEKLKQLSGFISGWGNLEQIRREVCKGAS